MNFPRLVPFTPDKLPALQEAAAADQHCVVLPTHTVERGGDLLGYFSLANVATTLMWLDSQKIMPRESMGLINSIELYLHLRGCEHNFTCCDPKSPFRAVMNHFGYQMLGSGDFFLKKL